MFLNSHGIEVLSETGLGITGDGGAMLAVEPEEWRRRVKDQNEPDSQAAFLSCTDIRAVEAIDALEADIGKPVVTSNQAMVSSIFASIVFLSSGSNLPPTFSSLIELRMLYA